MDHFRKALEKAEVAPVAASGSASVRDWMQPVRDGTSAMGSAFKIPSDRVVKTDSKVSLDSRLIAASKEQPAVLDRYRLLRTRVLQILKSHNWRVMAITSATPEAGKTLTTLNLGITCARAEAQRVIILDADMRKPSTAAMFGIEAPKGLADYLSGQAELAEIMYQPEGVANLTLIPGAGAHTTGLGNPSELLASPQFDALIKTLRGTGSLVLVDTPPLQVGDDVLSVAQRTDCFLLVIEEGKSTVPDVEEAARMLRDYNLIGTVLNKSSEQPKKFQSYYTSEDEPGASNP